MTGKRAGSRRAARPGSRLSPAVLGHAAAITVLVVAWGYLVFVAIDFGSSARSGNTGAWWLLGLASLGAVACLFAGLMLISRLGQVLRRRPGGEAGQAGETEASPAPRVPGGRRAAR